MMSEDKAIELLVRFRKDPLAFFEFCWGEEIAVWHKLREVTKSVVDNKRTVVGAGHGIGKSWLMARLAIWFLTVHRPAKVITTAPTWTQVSKILWSEMSSAISSSSIELGGKLLETEWKINDDTFAMGISTRESVGQRDFGATRMQGFHSPNLLVLLDEGAGVSQEIWTAIESIITGENNKVIAIGNPASPTGAFYECFKSPVWHKIYISSLEHPNVTGKGTFIEGCVTKEWVDERKKEWGEDSPLYKAKVLGQFPDEGTDSLFPLSMIERSRALEAKPNELPVLGVDVARFGDDETIVYSVNGNLVIREFVGRKLSITETVGKIIEIVRKYKQTADSPTRIQTIGVDDSGVGGGVTDLLRQELAKERCSVIAVNFGERADDTERYFNKKAEVFYRLRQAVNDGDLKLDHDDMLASQLASIKYMITGKGQVKIEGKDEMKKRGLRSPDRADALAIAYSVKNMRSIDVVSDMTREDRAILHGIMTKKF